MFTPFRIHPEAGSITKKIVLPSSNPSEPPKIGKLVIYPNGSTSISHPKTEPVSSA